MNKIIFILISSLLLSSCADIAGEIMAGVIVELVASPFQPTVNYKSEPVARNFEDLEEITDNNCLKLGEFKGTAYMLGPRGAGIKYARQNAKNIAAKFGATHIVWKETIYTKNDIEIESSVGIGFNCNKQQDDLTKEDLSVQITKINYRGDVFEVESDEYVEIQNKGDRAVNLKDWNLINYSAGTPSFNFPNSQLEPQKVIRVYTNEIHKKWGGFSFKYIHGSIWDNDISETAALYNDIGVEVSRKSY